MSIKSIEIRIKKSLFIEDGSLVAHVYCTLPDKDDFELLEPLISFLTSNYGSDVYGQDSKRCFRLYSNCKNFVLRPESVSQAVEWLNSQANNAIEKINKVVSHYLKVRELIPDLGGEISVTLLLEESGTHQS